jgi:hypothetical protein
MNDEKILLEYFAKYVPMKDENDNYRCAYDILKDFSKVWKSWCQEDKEKFNKLFNKR